RGGYRILRDAAATTVSLARGRKHHQAERNNRKDSNECHYCQADPRFCLHITIDIMTVEKRTQDPLPAAFLFRFVHRGRRPARGGTLPVVSGAGASKAPIGSLFGDGTTAFGFSGK